jgi:hypothetical protein
LGSTTTSYSQEITEASLNSIFASTARVAILRAFTLDPQRAYYQRQIEASTGLAIRAIQRELDRLTSIDLLFRRAEGNRVYYQVDTHFPLYPELRSMILKACSQSERLRGAVAADEKVRLAFLAANETDALVVMDSPREAVFPAPEAFRVTTESTEDFRQQLAHKPGGLQQFLADGIDLLGRRGDILWRRIEQAGFEVAKGSGVP